MFLVLRVYRQMEEELDETCADNENLEFDSGIYQSFETYRVSRPKKFFRFALLWVNVGLFLHMAVLGNFQLLLLFVVMSL